LLIY
jgi:hypothetical protein